MQLAADLGFWEQKYTGTKLVTFTVADAALPLCLLRKSVCSNCLHMLSNRKEAHLQCCIPNATPCQRQHLQVLVVAHAQSQCLPYD